MRSRSSRNSNTGLLGTIIASAAGLCAFSGVLLVSHSSGMQESFSSIVRAADEGPDAEMLEEIDATIESIYDVISGPAGEARDWDRFRGLFTESARLALSAPGPDGRRLISITPQEYIDRFGPQLEQGGFTERETHRVLEVFGTVAHAFSTYDGHLETNNQFRVEGINSIQLVRIGAPDAGEWKVHSILWHQKAPNEQIPERYRPQDDDEAGG